MTNYQTKTFPNHFSSSQLVNISWRIYCNKGINIKINLKCMHVSMYASMLLLGNNIYTPAGFVDVRQKKIIWIGT